MHRQQCNYHKAQKGFKDIVKIGLVQGDISGSTLILWSYENTFCAQRKQKYRLNSTILLPLMGQPKD